MWTGRIPRRLGRARRWGTHWSSSSTTRRRCRRCCGWCSVAAGCAPSKRRPEPRRWRARPPAIRISILLDLVLPDADGVDVTRRLRDWTVVPILVISARSDEKSRVKLLDAGANDFAQETIRDGRAPRPHPRLAPAAGPSRSSAPRFNRRSRRPSHRPRAPARLRPGARNSPHAESSTSCSPR